ncbi:MAG: hypothetical protein OQK46_06820 [Gammaproteobacteria bacterium]|nr:hypothetical protein [Gammaproteobacteria bacterium]
MNLDNLPSGDDVPRDFNVLPLHGSLVKYEAESDRTLVGVLERAGEAAVDHKVLAVPVCKLNKSYDDMLSRDTCFFEWYKTLETGNWVKVENRPGDNRSMNKYSRVSSVIIANLRKYKKVNIQGTVIH